MTLFFKQILLFQLHHCLSLQVTQQFQYLRLLGLDCPRLHQILHLKAPQLYRKAHQTAMFLQLVNIFLRLGVQVPQLLALKRHQSGCLTSRFPPQQSLVQSHHPPGSLLRESCLQHPLLRLHRVLSLVVLLLHQQNLIQLGPVKREDLDQTQSAHTEHHVKQSAQLWEHWQFPIRWNLRVLRVKELQ